MLGRKKTRTATPPTTGAPKVQPASQAAGTWDPFAPKQAPTVTGVPRVESPTVRIETPWEMARRFAESQSAAQERYAARGAADLNIEPERRSITDDGTAHLDLDRVQAQQYLLSIAGGGVWPTTVADSRLFIRRIKRTVHPDVRGGDRSVWDYATALFALTGLDAESLRRLAAHEAAHRVPSHGAR